MSQSKVSALEKLITDMKIEIVDLDEQINSLNRAIKDAESYIEKVGDSDFDSFKYFSPRTDGAFEKELAAKKQESVSLRERLVLIENQKKSMLEQIEKLTLLMKDEKEAGAAIRLEQDDKRRAALLLHDRSITSLFEVIDSLKTASADIYRNPNKVKAELDMAWRNITMTIDDMSDIIFDLYPSVYGHISFAEIFRKKAATISKKQGVKFDLLIEDMVSCETLDVVMAVYHIMNECLVNVEKHAKAKNVYFHASNTKDGFYCMELRDDGVGFDMKTVRQGGGLNMIKERVALLNGEIKINSIPGAGSSVHIMFPIV